MRLNSKRALSVVSSASLPNATRMSPLWTTSLSGMSICPCAIRLRKKWSMTTYASYARCRTKLHCTTQQHTSIAKLGALGALQQSMTYLIHAHHWLLFRAYTFVVGRRRGASANIGSVSTHSGWLPLLVVLRCQIVRRACGRAFPFDCLSQHCLRELVQVTNKDDVQPSKRFLGGHG
ncbi:hypothetical protein SCLCIDRAFT_1221886 [Scleroderma citrinum Foug A]|uniref:Uncharacterized protein n=1 Tax=Scleroderma citrinum Foug A TaxID=1036808 RepID=A0A0C3DDN3_9AGAM|nr:hypothetical protein SCLCIDRAFT_1221886 [Scleroderma citrinum Foug A]